MCQSFMLIELTLLGDMNMVNPFGDAKRPALASVHGIEMEDESTVRGSVVGGAASHLIIIVTRATF